MVASDQNLKICLRIIRIYIFPAVNKLKSKTMYHLTLTRFILGFLLCCGVSVAMAQSKSASMSPAAPDEVLKGFIKNYGDAKATWSESEGLYQADFKLIGMPATAWYDSTGHRTLVVVDIKSEQLPAIAHSYLNRNYPKAKVTRARKWTDDQKVSTFEAEIKAGTELKLLKFTSRGDLIKE